MRTVALILSILFSMGCGEQPAPVETGATFDRLGCFRQDKFGMFIHWGPYSELAGEWNGKQVPVGRNAEWIMQILKIPAADYRELARDFNPVKFDARRWAQLAKDTGMKYLVITSKHHDGFAMYKSSVSDYNIVDWTPFNRDPLKELSEACREVGIRFCIYYSHREDWDDPDAYGNDWDFDPAQKDFEKYLEETSKPQLRELLTNYGPFGLIWFDRGLYTPEQARSFVEIVRTLQPQSIINGRVGNYGQELMGDYQNMNDNGMPTGGIEEYWETPQTLNETWGYSKFDHNWKDSRTVIRRLVEIVSKGGNYLLNIGPMGDGSIPQPSVEILEGVGEWVRINGESIYGATASPFGELDWGRCTVKGETLYLHVFDWPSEARLLIPGLRNKPIRAYPLLDSTQELEVGREGAAAWVKLPAEPLDENDTVVVLEIDGPPEVEPPVVDQREAAIELDYLTAVTSGRAVKRYNRTGEFHISKWRTPSDTASWKVNITLPGRYGLRIEYAALAEVAGSPFQIAVGSQTLKSEVQDTGDWYEYREFEVGEIRVDTAGVEAITVAPAADLDHDMMYFRRMLLAPLPQ